jgi:hypothetical protein
MDQMRQEKATVGLAKGGGGKHGRKPVLAFSPELAYAVRDGRISLDDPLMRPPFPRSQTFSFQVK